ncbi:MAG: response regulator [Sedimenticola sp.]|nr:response regulator [Sedimenticola sp.]
MPEQQKDELKQAFIQHLPERLAAIDSDWQRISLKGWDRGQAESLYRRLQSLTSGSGRHGLTSLGENALPLELLLKLLIETNAAPSGEDAETARDLIKALRREGELIGKRRRESDGDGKRVYLLDVTDDLAPGLGILLQETGYSVSGFSRPDDLESEVQRRLPDVLILSGRMLNRMSLLNRELAVQQDLHKRQVGIICLSQSQDLEKRLLALRSGIDAYFITPVSNRNLMDKVAELSSSRPQQYRVLIVEDDRSQGDFAASILRKNGMQTSVITDPMDILHALDRFRPDLILMDLYMPDADGIELTTIIREHPDFMSTPIVFLSGELDTDKQLHALSVGGDDFLSKPIRPHHLVNTIRNRVQRARTLDRRHRHSSARDRESGLFTRRHFYQKLEEIAAASDEESLPGAVLHIRLHPPAAPLPGAVRAGFMASLGKAVSETIEEQDIAARMDENSFCVLLLRPHLKSIRQLARLLIQRLRSLEAGERYSPAIGIAAFENRIQNTADLVANATEASRLALAENDTIACHPLPESEQHRRIDSSQWPRLLREALEKNSLQPLFVTLRARDDNAPIHEMKFRLILSDRQHLGSNELLGLAAEHGLGVALSQWLIEQALSTLQQEHAEGMPGTLFVQQAADPIFKRCLIDWLRDRLRARQMVGSGLVLEYRIAELSKDLRAARRHFEQLHEMDIRVSLSRFGATTAALKVLDYLGADFVHLAGPVLTSGAQQIQSLQQAIRSAGARSVLPSVPKADAIAPEWREVADLAPATRLAGDIDG